MAACGDDSPTDPTPLTEQVTGTVTYRERIALPAEAVVQVTLEDVSLQDVAATVIGETTITNPGQVPIPFAVEYDPSAIVPNNTYTVRARISVSDDLWFTNTTAYPVITRDNPTHDVEMILTFVRG
jgi:putative lipoprotein